MSGKMKLEKKKYTKDMKFKQKIAYFWDYYKWFVVFGAVFLVALISLIYDISSNKTPDLTVIYAGTESYAEYTQVEGEAALAEIIPDLNGDGTIYPSLRLFVYADDGSLNQMDMAQQMAMYAEMAVGDAYLMILTPDFYETYQEQEAFVNLNEMFGLALEDPYGIPYSDTMLSTLAGFTDLPDNAVVAVLQAYGTLGNSEKEKDKALFEQVTAKIRELYSMDKAS